MPGFYVNAKGLATMAVIPGINNDAGKLLLTVLYSSVGPFLTGASAANAAVAVLTGAGGIQSPIQSTALLRQASGAVIRNSVSTAFDICHSGNFSWKGSVLRVRSVFRFVKDAISNKWYVEWFGDLNAGAFGAVILSGPGYYGSGGSLPELNAAPGAAVVLGPAVNLSMADLFPDADDYSYFTGLFQTLLLAGTTQV